VLRRAEKCNGAYHCDRQRHGSARAGCRCLTTYAGGPLLFPRESAYVAAMKKRSGRDCGARACLSLCLLFFLLFSFRVFPPAFRVPFRPRSRFPRARARSSFFAVKPKPLLLSRPFVSHARALITSFRVRRRGRSY